MKNTRNKKQCVIHDVSDSKFNMKIIEFNLDNGIFMFSYFY